MSAVWLHGFIGLAALFLSSGAFAASCAATGYADGTPCYGNHNVGTGVVLHTSCTGAGSACSLYTCNNTCMCGPHGSSCGGLEWGGTDQDCFCTDGDWNEVVGTNYMINLNSCGGIWKNCNPSVEWRCKPGYVGSQAVFKSEPEPDDCQPCTNCMIPYYPGASFFPPYCVTPKDGTYANSCADESGDGIGGSLSRPCEAGYYCTGGRRYKCPPTNGIYKGRRADGDVDASSEVASDDRSQAPTECYLNAGAYHDSLGSWDSPGNCYYTEQ